MKASQLVVRLRSLARLEGTWYADVGRKTGEQCCQAMREAADEIETWREVCDNLREGRDLWKEEWRLASARSAELQKALKELLQAAILNEVDLDFGEAAAIRMDAIKRAEKCLAEETAQ